MAALSVAESSCADRPSSRVGMGGNSSAGVVLMLALAEPQERFSWVAPGGSTRLMGRSGRDATSSDRSLAGTVVAPSSSMLDGIQVVRDTWRLVPEILRRGPSVARRMFFVIGRLDLFDITRLVRESTWFSCSLVQESFMFGGSLVCLICCAGAGEAAWRWGVFLW